MRPTKLALLLAAVLLLPLILLAEKSNEEIVRDALRRSTLNQPGTHPFHLKAALAPSLERDRDSNRTGEVEIWWRSPTEWRREVRSPTFHQIAIVNGGQEWQKNEGDYFPEWLRLLAVALIDPIPHFERVVPELEGAEVRKMFGATHFSWAQISTDGQVEKGMGAGIDVSDHGLLVGAFGLGWGAGFKDYKGFHNLQVARTLVNGAPEVTARVEVLEDLNGYSDDFFATTASGSDPNPIHTATIDELTLRKNLTAGPPPVWPALKDGPLTGVLSTKVVIDRQGHVREVGTILSDNPGISEPFGKYVGSMQFQPYLENGQAVQVVSRITMPFKTVRPEGVEAFDRAGDYFERGRKAGSPAAHGGSPYVLRATFTTTVKAQQQQGEYVDTWQDDGHWRREAKIAGSRYARSRNGETWYQLSEGSDAGIAKFVLFAIEPIPTLDTYFEGDWRIKRDTAYGLNTIRVMAGYENPQGELDPVHNRGFWFDANGNLIKNFDHGLAMQRLELTNYSGANIPKEIRIFHGDGLAMVIRLESVGPAPAPSDNFFVLKGHEWKRQFTAEAR